MEQNLISIKIFHVVSAGTV